MHKKGITEEVAKKRSRKNVKVQVSRVSFRIVRNGYPGGCSLGSESVPKVGIYPSQEFAVSSSPFYAKLRGWGFWGKRCTIVPNPLDFRSRPNRSTVKATDTVPSFFSAELSVPTSLRSSPSAQPSPKSERPLDKRRSPRPKLRNGRKRRPSQSLRLAVLRMRPRFLSRA